MEVINKIKKLIHSKKVKGHINKIKTFVINNKYIFLMTLPFILMEIFISLFGMKISYINYRFYSPLIFTACWIILFVGLSISFNKAISKTIYICSNVIFLAMFLVNGVYYSMTKTFFDFNLVESASEGAPYMLDALKNCNPFIYIAFLLIICTIVVCVKKMPTYEKNNYKRAGVIVVLFLLLHILAPISLGKANGDLSWANWRNPRNIYISFNDSNKSIKISGFLEYTVRNFYITFLKKDDKLNEEDIAFLNEIYVEGAKHKNNYTGKYKGKNLILLQLEGMDNWIINKNDTPTLYKMMNNSINFTNHYSYYNGGGSTFNSEFAVNTGFITPLSYTKNAYTFNKNDFPYSLANLFKKENYSVNAFHMNTGEYYSRTVNYKNWGYDNYYGLIDVDNYDNYLYQLDRELILNEKFNTMMFPEEGNFVDYIITYSGHLPFTNTKGVCRMLYNEDIKAIYGENYNEEEIEFVEMSEEECVRRQAKETDYMISLLLDNLKEKGLYDNTVIVLYADHYLYTLEDQTILDRYKNTDNNLINKTPLFIWTSKSKKTNINKVTSQLNILPTVLNLFGIEYNVNNYIGEDALDKKYSGIAFFSDYSWYDGNVYVENGEVTNGKKISDENLEKKNYYINNITKKNDLTLKFNYFKNVDK